LALFIYPIHVDWRDVHFWEAEGEPVVEDSSKCGVFKLTTIKRATLPNWWTNYGSRLLVYKAVAFLCAAKVLPIFERAFPSDPRPRRAIEAAIRCYSMQPDEKEMRDARAAVRDTMIFIGKTSMENLHETRLMRYDAIHAAWAAQFAVDAAWHTLNTADITARFAMNAVGSAKFAALYTHPRKDVPIVPIITEAIALGELYTKEPPWPTS
jgi:hypothetical protein